jgi:hypothetical protein
MNNTTRVLILIGIVCLGIGSFASTAFLTEILWNVVAKWVGLPPMNYKIALAVVGILLTIRWIFDRRDD